MDEIGIPRTISQTLTFPEIANNRNIQELNLIVKRGPRRFHSEPPGATYVVRKNGHRIDLRSVKDISNVTVEIGDVVERHMRDGDVVVCSRQTAIKKTAMMGHRVKVLPSSTIRISPICASFDYSSFEGDHVNLHFPQSLETKAEIESIQMASLQIKTPQFNKPVIGFVQDTLCGVSKLTKRDVFLEKEQVMNLVMFLPTWDGKVPQPAILKPRPQWTGNLNY